MKKSEVLEILHGKIVVENKYEFPNEEKIKTIEEIIHLVLMIDDLEEEKYSTDDVVCINCGELVSECVCKCESCDTCDDCICSKGKEISAIPSDEYDKLVANAISKIIFNDRLKK